MRAPAAVGVDDDLAPGEAGVAVGAADDETARGVQVVNGVIVEVLGRDHVLDDVLLKVGVDLVVRDDVIVLARDHDGVDSLGHHAAVLLLVRHGHLLIIVDRNANTYMYNVNTQEQSDEGGKARERVRHDVCTTQLHSRTHSSTGQAVQQKQCEFFWRK